MPSCPELAWTWSRPLEPVCVGRRAHAERGKDSVLKGVQSASRAIITRMALLARISGNIGARDAHWVARTHAGAHYNAMITRTRPTAPLASARNRWVYQYLWVLRTAGPAPPTPLCRRTRASAWFAASSVHRSPAAAFRLHPLLFMMVHRFVWPCYGMADQERRAWEPEPARCSVRVFHPIFRGREERHLSSQLPFQPSTNRRRAAGGVIGY